MNKLRYLLLLVAACTAIGMSAAEKPFAKYAKFYRYENANKMLKDSINNGKRVVFMGNSITDHWAKMRPEFFKKNEFVGRGISGQTSYEMLSRFREDVVNLKPAGVVICCGTNDIAQNLYDWYDEDRSFGNIVSMAEIAKANGIKVILASVPPVTKFNWSPSITNIAPKIKSLNTRIKEYAKNKGYGYIDYYSSMVSQGDIMNPAYSEDGVHPNAEGYAVMESLALPAIRKKVR